jgi:hypothetical protein
MIEDFITPYTMADIKEITIAPNGMMNFVLTDAALLRRLDEQDAWMEHRKKIRDKLKK